LDPVEVISRCSSVDIFPPSSGGTIGAFPKASGVVWNVTESYIEVLEPCDYKGNPIFFSEGEEVFLSFAVGSKRKGFKSKVIGSSASPRVVKLSLSKSFEMCELRGSVRVPVHFCATFRYPTPEGDAMVGGVVGDLTARGCFATVAGMLPLDIPILCSLFLNEAGTVNVLAKAVRVTPTGVTGFNGYGIMFDSLSQDAAEIIEEAMRNRVPVLREICSMISDGENGEEE